jgi:FkbM family methyltransferase
VPARPTKRRMTFDLVVWHVGGGGPSYGPAGKFVERYADNSTFVLFDARSDAEEFKASGDRRRMVLNRCLGDYSGPVKFYAYEYAHASSLLRLNEDLANERTGHPTLKTWGEFAKIDEVIDLEMTTVDSLIEKHGVPPPDFLSLDVQGAEGRVFAGAIRTLPGTLAVISEFQTLPVYRGQALFHDQCKLLLDSGFRLVDLVNTEFWHPAEPAGKGFLTAGDAIFLRQVSDDMSFAQLLKLATLAAFFDRLSYASKILDLMQQRYPHDFAANKEHSLLREIRKSLQPPPEARRSAAGHRGWLGRQWARLRTSRAAC